MSKHGLGAYKDHRCRCKICMQAYETDLTKRAKRRKGKRDEHKRLPSVTNTLAHDTMTKQEYDRFRSVDYG
jgi:hypothetical protein